MRYALAHATRSATWTAAYGAWQLGSKQFSTHATDVWLPCSVWGQFFHHHFTILLAKAVGNFLVHLKAVACGQTLFFFMERIKKKRYS